MYVCLCKSEIDDLRGGREGLGLFSYYKAVTLPGSGIVLFESGLGLVVNVYYKI